MKHFLRVIKLSLVNKWTIALLMANSLLIGVLWGGSITAIYPFVEVVFSGNTIETWLDAEIEKSGQSTLRATAIVDGGCRVVASASFTHRRAHPK